MPQAGVAFTPLPARGWDRARPLTLLTSTALLVASTLRAVALIERVRPDVVAGFGGYVSIPVGLAAVLRGVPLVLHEQNSVPGLSNRVLSRFARAVCETYEESSAHLAHPERVVWTGNPVRPAVLASTAERGREALGIAPVALVLLAFGGSRGARHLNTALVGSRDRILADPRVHVVHVAGALEADAVRTALDAAGGDGGGRWQVREYIDDMGSAIAAADLVLARAGATSIAEITALGRPAVLVPYPYATDDHQTKNASTMVAHGAAELVTDAELDTIRFGDVLTQLLGDGSRRATMADASRALGRKDAAERVVRVLREAVGTSPSARRSDDTSTTEDTRA